MKKVIFIGANTKATFPQCDSAERIGEVLANQGYTTVHGGGDGTMGAITRGIRKVNPECNLCHIITPENMLPSDQSPYNKVEKWDMVDTVHTRIGKLINISNECKYVIVYGGGIGTIHELMSILVHWYHNTTYMPYILVCTEDAKEWCDHISGLLTPLCIKERPYILNMKERLIKVSSKELEDVILTDDLNGLSYLLSDNKQS